MRIVRYRFEWCWYFSMKGQVFMGIDADGGEGRSVATAILDPMIVWSNTSAF